MTGHTSLGAVYHSGHRCQFYVWAPQAENVAVHLLEPRERLEPLRRVDRGYHYRELTAVTPGSLYYYVLDGEKERPDPASRCQPRGVHGPSQVVDTGAWSWSDHDWPGWSQQELIFYELHVGTYTPEGTFEALIPHLEALRDLGVTAIELMPVAQFPGSRNWGYDGVYPFAVQHSYGGPAGLGRLVDACHRRGLAVFLDVVYNHLGPEGNYLRDFGPYFTDRYRTPWGDALNFDGPGSDEVRRFFIENALYWLTEFHLDGLRLDAVHAITDQAALPFLEELTATIHGRAAQLGRRFYIIGESDRNAPRLIQPRTAGGHELDGQWSDDFHHALHALVTGERNGYYQDFGTIHQLAAAFREGYVYTGQYSSFRQRRHGRRPVACAAPQFVVSAQNHDQTGNRAGGERLSALVSFDALKLAAGLVLLSPFLPLLFMGEEYGETAPFLYFTSYTNPALAEAVRQGRRGEFAASAGGKKAPDPQDEATFLRSRLRHDTRRQDRHRILREFYRELIRLRRELPALANLSREDIEAVAFEQEQVLFIRRWHGRNEIFAVFTFNGHEAAVTLPAPAGRWRKRLDAAEKRWLGGGSSLPDRLVSVASLQISLPPGSCVLYERY